MNVINKMASPHHPLSFGAVEIYSDDEDKVLGVGSYGKVCRAKYGQLPCAAKLLHETMFEGGDPGRFNFAERFEQECQFLSMIKHPNIVQYLGTSKDPRSQRLALLTELMDESLTRFLERSTGPISYHIQLNICHDVALALSYLHSNDIIHRDLSSNNVLLIGEGGRAKVTDFGMSKLTDVNPRMTPLTQCPGATVYMPPEALTNPPHYSSKLDCFSHGVLAIQIVTKKFPSPGNATTTVEDSRFPTGRVVVFVPEAERRKEDISLINPQNSLLPIALHCIKDRDTERPSADEVCDRLATLKREKKYTHSVEQTRNQESHFQSLRKELVEYCELVQKERADHQREKADLESKVMQRDRLIQKERADHKKELKEREEIINQILDGGHHHLPVKGAVKEHKAKVPKEFAPAVEAIDLAWSEGKRVPQNFSSATGRSISLGNTAYFSCGDDIYSFNIHDNEWTKLPKSKYKCFSMAVIHDKLTTIGGQDRNSNANALMSLLDNYWIEVFPPMPTSQADTTVATTQTHIIVAAKDLLQILNMETLQWFKTTNIPQSSYDPWITISDGYLYLRQHDAMHSCSVERMIKSCEHVRGDKSFVWTGRADMPVRVSSSLVVLRDNVLAIGGNIGMKGGPTTAVHYYDKTRNSWNVIGHLPTPLSGALTAVLPTNEIIVVCGTCVYIGRIV